MQPQDRAKRGKLTTLARLKKRAKGGRDPNTVDEDTDLLAQLRELDAKNLLLSPPGSGLHKPWKIFTGFLLRCPPARQIELSIILLLTHIERDPAFKYADTPAEEDKMSQYLFQFVMNYFKGENEWIANGRARGESRGDVVKQRRNDVIAMMVSAYQHGKDAVGVAPGVDDDSDDDKPLITAKRKRKVPPELDSAKMERVAAAIGSSVVRTGGKRVYQLRHNSSATGPGPWAQICKVQARAWTNRLKEALENGTVKDTDYDGHRITPEEWNIGGSTTFLAARLGPDRRSQYQNFSRNQRKAFNKAMEKKSGRVPTPPSPTPPSPTPPSPATPRTPPVRSTERDELDEKHVDPPPFRNKVALEKELRGDEVKFIPPAVEEGPDVWSDVESDEKGAEKAIVNAQAALVEAQRALAEAKQELEEEEEKMVLFPALPPAGVWVDTDDDEAVGDDFDDDYPNLDEGGEVVIPVRPDEPLVPVRHPCTECGEERDEFSQQCPLCAKGLGTRVPIEDELEEREREIEAEATMRAEQEKREYAGRVAKREHALDKRETKFKKLLRIAKYDGWEPRFISHHYTSKLVEPKAEDDDFEKKHTLAVFTLVAMVKVAVFMLQDYYWGGKGQNILRRMLQEDTLDLLSLYFSKGRISKGLRQTWTFAPTGKRFEELKAPSTPSKDDMESVHRVSAATVQYVLGKSSVWRWGDRVRWNVEDWAKLADVTREGGKQKTLYGCLVSGVLYDMCEYDEHWQSPAYAKMWDEVKENRQKEEKVYDVITFDVDADSPLHVPFSTLCKMIEQTFSKRLKALTKNQ